MHLYKTIKNFLFDQDYFLDLWQKKIHVYGFIDIVTLQEQKIVLAFPDFQILILGTSFHVLKLTKNEILLEGELESIQVQHGN